MSDLTDVELAYQIQDDLNEAEARMEAANVDARLIRRFKRAHASIADIAEDLKLSGEIIAYEGTPKPGGGG